MPQLQPIPESFTRSIASREYRCKGAAQTVSITLEIGEPIQDVPVAGGQDWRCPVRIVNDQSTLSLAGYGVDAVQAMMCALQVAGQALAQYAAEHGWTLLWLGQDLAPGELGP